MSIIETGNYGHLSPTDIQAIKDAAKERSAALMRMEKEKDVMKEITAAIKEEYGIKPGDFNDLAMTYHRQDLAEKKAKFENRTELFEMVFGKDDLENEKAEDNE